MRQLNKWTKMLSSPKKLKQEQDLSRKYIHFVLFCFEQGSSVWNYILRKLVVELIPKVIF